jgi:hypothetical protein
MYVYEHRMKHLFTGSNNINTVHDDSFFSGSGDIVLFWRAVKIYEEA